MKVICGDMEFGTFVIDGKQGFYAGDVCIVHKLQATLDVPDDHDLDALLKEYDSYVVPAQFKGDIVYSQPQGESK